jgi:membrane-bound lytic murein transglycosylase D
MRRVSLRAGKHDSVETIARRYRVPASQVAQWNDVGTAAKFAPGQTVVVYVAPKGRATTSTRFASTVHGTKVAHSTHRSSASSGKHVVAKR